jgi:hypothetical protein
MELFHILVNQGLVNVFIYANCGTKSICLWPIYAGVSATDSLHDIVLYVNINNYESYFTSLYHCITRQYKASHRWSHLSCSKAGMTHSGKCGTSTGDLLQQVNIKNCID